MSKSFNRTVEEINPLLDKIDNNYSRNEIDSLLAAINQSIATISERVSILENQNAEGGEDS